MAQITLLKQPQGRSGRVGSEPLEIVDMPQLYTEEVLRRFPSLMKRQAEINEWWDREKNRQIALRDLVEALRKKVNAT